MPGPRPKPSKKMSKPVPLGGMKKKKNTSKPAKPRTHGNANTPGFAYGRKTI